MALDGQPLAPLEYPCGSDVGLGLQCLGDGLVHHGILGGRGHGTVHVDPRLGGGDPVPIDDDVVARSELVLLQLQRLGHSLILYGIRRGPVYVIVGLDIQSGQVTLGPSQYCVRIG